MPVSTTSPVTDTPAAHPDEAKAHFARRLSFETDCADVYTANVDGTKDFVLVDVRSERLFAEAHVPGSVHIPRAELTAERLAAYGPETLFVVYCAGPHCNGANRAALQIASLGRPVKEMIGGIIGWRDEGFPVETGAA